MDPEAPRILVVEDSATQAAELELVLEEAGFAPIVARDGAEALERLGRERVDAVLLDVIMPGMSGFEVCRRIRQNPRTANVGVVLLTTLNKPEDIVRGMEAGADAYLNKPCSSDQLATTLRRALRPAAERQRIEAAMRGVGSASRAIGYLLSVLDQFAAARASVHQGLEDSLRRSEERFALAAAGANDGLWDWDLRTGQVYFSPRWWQIAGEPENSGEGKLDQWLSRVHPDDRERVEANFDAVIKGDLSRLEVEHRFRHASGAWRWVLARGFVLRDAAGRANRVAGSLTDLTERKELEQRLLDAQAELDAVFRSFPDVYGRLDAQGIVRDVHVGAAGGLPRDPARLLGKHIGDLVPAEARERVLDAFRQARETGRVRAVEFILPTDERGPRYAEVRFAPIRGTPDVLAIGRDMTRWRKTEAQVRELRRQLDVALEAAGIGAWSWDPRTDRCEADRRVLDIFGVPAEEFDGRLDRLLERVAPADREMIARAVADVRSGKAPWNGEYTVVVPPGKSRRVRTWATRIPDDPNGRVVGVVQDVTADAARREELANERARLEATLACAPFGVVLVDRDCRIADANPAAACVLGLEGSDPRSRRWDELPWADPAAVRAEVRRVFSGACESMQVEHGFGGGERRRIIRLAYAPKRRDGAAVDRLVVALLDITEETTLMARLSDAEQRYEELVESIHGMAFAVDREGVITYVSPGAEKVSGHRPQEMLGRPLSNFVHPDDLRVLQENFRRALEGNPDPEAVRIVRIFDRKRRAVPMRGYTRAVRKGDVVVGFRGVLVRFEPRAESRAHA